MAKRIQRAGVKSPGHRSRGGSQRAAGSPANDAARHSGHMQRPRGSSWFAGSAGKVLHQHSNGFAWRPQSNIRPQRGQRTLFTSVERGIAEAVIARAPSRAGSGGKPMMPRSAAHLHEAPPAVRFPPSGAGPADAGTLLHRPRPPMPQPSGRHLIFPVAARQSCTIRRCFNRFRPFPPPCPSTPTFRRSRPL